MFDQTLYEKNLQSLSSINKPLADAIRPLKIRENQPKPSSKEEIQTWYQSLDLDQIIVLYVYGVGSGDAYEVIHPWLKSQPNRHVVFLEDDLQSFHYFLGTTKAVPLLNNIQVDIQDATDAVSQRSKIRSITQDNMLRPAAITALPSYLEKESSNFIMIRDLIIFESAEQNIQFKELSELGSQFYKNFYTNILQLPKAYDGRGLFDKFKGIPAIICGSGPSLVRHIPLLKKLLNKALIFAPSSSLNILTSHGIWPHFGVALDPTHDTYHRQYMQRGYETPIFYQNRIFSEALSAIEGPKLFLPDDIFYLIEDWFQEQLNLPTETFEAGYSSVHTAMLIAQHLGCRPFIFLGVELSKSSDSHYPTGVEKHPLFPIIPQEKPELGSPIQVKDIKGREVTSYWPWIAEADWIDTFYRSNPSIPLINATEAGIGLFSVPNQTLEEAAKQWLTQDYDLETRVHTAIQEAGLLPVTRMQITDNLEIFFQSLTRCSGLITEICKNITNHNQEERNKLEKQFKKEIGYQYLLIQMEDFFLKFIQKDLRNLQRLSTQEKEIKQQQLDLLAYQFLTQAIEMNRQLIAQALNQNLSAAPSLSSPLNDQEMPAHISLADELNGKIKTYYYASGAIYSIQAFDKGLRDGTHLYYYPNGALKSEINYLEGQLNGFTRLYYPSGMIKREIHFKNGQRHEKEMSWYENGQKYTEVDYQDNIPRHAKCWYSDGQLAKDITL